MRRKSQGQMMLILIALLVAAAYFYSQKYDGFATDASGNTAGVSDMNKSTAKSVNIPWWGWLLIVIVIIVVALLSLWSFIIKWKAIGKVADGAANALSGIGSGVRKWAESK